MKKGIIVFILIILLVLNISANELPTKKISFDFTDVPLSYILNAICNVNDMNLIFDSANNKNVSISFDKIETNRALKLILKQNNLSYLYEDNILIVDTEDRIETVYDNKPITILGETELLINKSKADPGQLIINNEKPEKNPGYRIKDGINKGSLIPARLEVGLISSTRKTPVLLRITKNINYENELIIPKGSLMTGVALADFNARQIFIDLDTLIIKNKEIDIKAHMVKKDGTPGFVSEYRDLTKEGFWQSFLLGFVGLIGNGFKDKLYIEDDQGIVQPIEADSLKNDLIENTQDGINEFSNEAMAAAKKHNAIITVEAGEEGFVFIDDKITIDKLKK